MRKACIVLIAACFLIILSFFVNQWLTSGVHQADVTGEPIDVLGEPTKPVTIDCVNISETPVKIRLKDMSFTEVVRVHWRLVNPGSGPVRLTRVRTDCTCVAVEPTEAEIPPHTSLDGFLDYTQGTLGYTRRLVFFETSVGIQKLQLSSLKLRSHYISPTVVKTRDDDFTITWSRVYLRRQGVPRFQISAVDSDGEVIELVDREMITPRTRYAQGPKAKIEYDLEATELNFRITPACPISRYETEIRITIGDTGGELNDHVYRIPVYVVVSRGIQVEPSAVMLGFNTLKNTKFPIRRRVRISGLSGSRLTNLKVLPEDSPVRVSIAEDSEDVVVLEVVVDDAVPTNKPLKATVTASIHRKNSSTEDQMLLSVSGIFMENTPGQQK